MKPVDLTAVPLRVVRSRRSALCMAICVALLAGCGTTGSKMDMPAVALPNAYQNALAPAGSGAADTMRGEWWTQFGSEELNHLVDRSLAYNSELRVATLQVAQAKIRADQARGARWPVVTAPVRAVVQ